MIAYLNLRYMDDKRAQMFRTGLASLGYQIVHGMTHNPNPGDVLCSWNRIGDADHAADCFAARGCKVIIAENASWGNELAGDHWYHLALNFHNTDGCFPVGGPERWDNLGVELQPMRTSGETVVLPQRGIGPVGVAMPPGWLRGKEGRIRPHPGRRNDMKPLEEDLATAGRVLTWGSGAAVKALMMGVRVFADYCDWIALQDNSEEGRLAMFRKLAWAQWTHSEIESGQAFKHLLGIQ